MTGERRRVVCYSNIRLFYYFLPAWVRTAAIPSDIARLALARWAMVWSGVVSYTRLLK